MSTREQRAAEQRAHEVLEQFQAYTAPIDIEMIADRLGIRIVKQPLEDEMSGVLVVRNGQAAIGVNENHSPRRQRFTIAHEVAHYLLHLDDTDLFVDEMLTFYRDDHSAEGTHRREREANALAAALLMPRHLIEHELRGRQIDLFDEAAIARLARRFGVSTQALTIRLMNLDMLSV